MHAGGLEGLLGALGGAAVFLTAIIVTIRAVFKQIGSIDRNTAALDELRHEIQNQGSTLNDHEHRISMLEGRTER